MKPLVHVGLWVTYIKKMRKILKTMSRWCAAARPPVPGKRAAL
jgi:hypothetical protein